MLYAEDVLDTVQLRFSERMGQLFTRPLVPSYSRLSSGINFTVSYSILLGNGQVSLAPTSMGVHNGTLNEYRLVGEQKALFCSTFRHIRPPSTPSVPQLWNFDTETRPLEVVVEEILASAVHLLRATARAWDALGTLDFCDSCPHQLTCLGEFRYGS